jgi:photosystem II stability/assembly factor-like uncharacterized protein
MNKIFCISLSLFCIVYAFADISNAQTTSSWERISPLPQEQTLNAVTTIPGTNTIVAVGEGSTVMISHDAAVTWDIIHNPGGKENFFKLFRVFFITQDTGFISGNKESILKTVDGGYSWYEVKSETGSYNSCLSEITFVNDTMGFATASSGRLYITYDTGETWVLDNSSLIYNLDRFIVKDENSFILSSTGRYVFLTENGGSSWDTLDVDQDMDFVNIMDLSQPSDSVLIISAEVQNEYDWSHKIYRSVDGGYNWVEVGSLWKSGFISDIHFFDALHGVVVISTNVEYSATCMETWDGGLTWEVLPGGIFYIYYRNGHIISDTSLIAVGMYGAIHISDDYGHSWNSEYSSSLEGDVIDSYFVNDMLGYCLTKPLGGGVIYSPLYRTTDGGDVWEKANWATMSDINGIFFCDPDTGYIVSEVFGLEISRTFNGGKDWELFFSDVEPEEIRAITFLNAKTGYIVGFYGLYRTNDFGETWQRVDELDYSFYDVISLDDNQIYALATQYGSDAILIHSPDGGLTWDVSTINIPSGENIFVLDNGRLLIQQYTSIYYSDDNGITWIQANVNIGEHFVGLEAYFVNESVGYIVGFGSSNNFLKTTDGGETWYSYPTEVTAKLSEVHFFDENHGIVMGENGIILRTDNGGTTFIEEKPAIPQQPSAITLFPNPATEILNITFEDPQQRGELIFYSTNGTEVMRRAHNPNVTGIIMNVDGMDAGAYVVQYVVDSKIIETTKIVIR